MALLRAGLAILVGAALLGACGRSSPFDPVRELEPDAAVDTSGSPDASARDDAGTSFDAGVPDDAGVLHDAGVDAGTPDAGCVSCTVAGCADGTREGFTDHTAWPDIAACAGPWSGWIDEPSAAALCAPGWHVCKGSDAVLGKVWASHSSAFPGCFAVDSAHDCWACYPTCRGALGRCLKCCVSTSVNDPDMGGVGANCTQYQGAGPGSSCLGFGRVDATVNSTGCQWAPHITGVTCCRD